MSSGHNTSFELIAVVVGLALLFAISLTTRWYVRRNPDTKLFRPPSWRNRNDTDEDHA